MGVSFQITPPQRSGQASEGQQKDKEEGSRLVELRSQKIEYPIRRVRTARSSGTYHIIYVHAGCYNSKICRYRNSKLNNDRAVMSSLDYLTTRRPTCEYDRSFVRTISNLVILNAD
jgi:hypothetical protein